MMLYTAAPWYHLTAMHCTLHPREEVVKACMIAVVCSTVLQNYRTYDLLVVTSTTVVCTVSTVRINRSFGRSFRVYFSHLV